jgi:hypothetical protein
VPARRTACVQATVAQRGARRTLAILSAYKRHSYAVA